MKRDIPSMKISRYFILSLLSVGLIACDEGTSETAPDAPMLSTTAVTAENSECASGGILIETGVDKNINGVLDETEVDNQELVCNGMSGEDGTDGTSMMISQSAEPAGDNCFNGGMRFDVGFDDNIDGMLDTDEISSTEYICTPDPISMGQAPGIVSAISISNTEILVQFSEAIETGAENAVNYGINSVETGTRLPILSAVFASADQSSIVLTTLSQSGTEYNLKVSNLRDADGNPVYEPTGPSTTTFTGTDPNILNIADSDGDSIMDHDELIGWTVVVTRADGTVDTKHVSSDPGDPNQALDSPLNIAAKDTDGDGVMDNIEKQFGMDPRNTDTDGDGLTDDQEWNKVYSLPTHQDTDGDSLLDGLEFNTFRTSPNLVDTDGDQLNDFEEILSSNRNPLIADIPIPRITVDGVGLSLNTVITITDSEGSTREDAQSVEVGLVRGESSESASMSQNSTEREVSAGVAISKTASVEVTAGVTPEVTASGEVTVDANVGYSSTEGSVFTAEESSARSSEEAYTDSFSSSAEVSSDTSTTRELVSGRINASVSIDNASNLPFSISNMEVSIRKINPRDRNDFIAVASLLPSDNVRNDGINIGVLGEVARGPFIFSTSEDAVYAQQVDELLRSPDSLMVELSNYDLVDEKGRNFSWSSQDVLDKTASLTFDLGEGRKERYLIATSSAHNPSNGKPLGITMAYAMSVIGLERYATIRDGGNGIVETLATGDDVQLPAPTGSEVGLGDDIEPAAIIVRAGVNNEIDSVPGGDDYLQRSDYATIETESRDTIRDGGNGVFESVALDDDVLVRPTYSDGSPYPIVNTMILPGANGVLDSSPSGDDVTVLDTPSHRVLSRYKDVEINGLEKSFWAMLQSDSVLPVDFDKRVLRAGDNYDFIYVQDNDFDGLWSRQEITFGSSDERVNTDACEYLSETDRDDGPCGDTLTDMEEAVDGWFVALESTEGYRVYSNPRAGDSDLDGLHDHEEKACQLDPRSRDSDKDGLSDYEEITGRFDQINFEGAEPAELIETPYSGDGTDGQVHHAPNTDCIAETGIDGYYTNPLNRDTDGDKVDDRIELQLGLDPNDPDDGASFVDSDNDGLSNKEELDGYLIDIIQVSGIRTPRRVFSSPDEIDSDGDGLNDLLERRLGSDASKRDTDGDGLSDDLEYSSESQCIDPNSALGGCVIWSDYNRYVDDCLDAPGLSGCREEFVGTGSDLNAVDSDDDGLDDLLETRTYTITVNGLDVSTRSSPTRTNSDTDEWDDGKERDEGTNPVVTDTDADGLSDSEEENHCSSVNDTQCRNPVAEDALIEVRPLFVTVFRGDGGNNNELCAAFFKSRSVPYTLSLARMNFGEAEEGFTSIDEGNADVFDPPSDTIFDELSSAHRLVVDTSAGQGFALKVRLDSSTEVDTGTLSAPAVGVTVGNVYLRGGGVPNSSGCPDPHDYHVKYEYERIN